MGWQQRVGLRVRPWRRVMPLAVVAMLALALTGCSKGQAAAEPTGLPVNRVSVQKFKYAGMPTSIKPGETIITFSNREAGQITHEMILLGLKSGQTAKDIVAAAKKKGQDAEGEFPSFGEIGDVRTGATAAAVFSLPAGTYAFACFEKGKLDGGEGPVHATIGMTYQFTVG
jgi:uncharacterized cupredoxin-like copper-binding protein